MDIRKQTSDQNNKGRNTGSVSPTSNAMSSVTTPAKDSQSNTQNRVASSKREPTKGISLTNIPRWLIIIIVLLLLSVGFWLFSSGSNDSSLQNSTTAIELPTELEDELVVSPVKTLTVNGQLRLNGSFVLPSASTDQQEEEGITAGQTYYNPNTQSILYYDGSTIQTVATTESLVELQDSIDNSSFDGVSQLSGTANQVLASSTSGSVTLSLPQDIATSSSPTFNNLQVDGQLSSNGNLLTSGNFQLKSGNFVAAIASSALSANRTYTLPDETGTFCLTSGNCAGAGGGIVGSGTNGELAFFTGSDTISSSADLLFNGTDFTVNATTTFNESLTVAATNTLTLTGGTTAQRPGLPSEGEIFFDTDTDTLLTYSNGKWQADRGEYVIVAASDSSQAEKDSADYVADGEIGDGQTTLDGDQVEINQALTDATGGKVLLLAGTYVADASIAIPNNTTLAGVGSGTVIELADIDTSENLIENSDTSTGTSVVIRDLKLDGRKDLNTAGAQSGIYANSLSDGVIIRDVYIDRFRSHGLYVNNSENSNIVGLTSDETDLYGIYIDSSDYVTVANSLFLNINSLSSYARDSNNLTISSSIFRNGSSEGIRLHNISNSSITGNQSINNGTGLYATNSFDNTFTGNGFSNNTYYGLRLADSDQNTASGNSIRDNTWAGFHIYRSDGNSITGNSISDNGNIDENEGIRIVQSDSNIIASNIIGDFSCTTTCYAINITDSASEETYIANNTFSGIASTINDAGTNTAYAGQTDGSGNYAIQGFSGAILLGESSADTLTVNATTTFNESLTVAATKTLTLIGGTTAQRPSSPNEGEIFFDTDTDTLLTYSNGKWQADRGEYVIVAASDSSQAEKDSADYVVDGADDQVEINAALTEATGGKVLLLAGTYTTHQTNNGDATIFIPNNTTLAGVGNGTVIELGDIDASDNLIENSDTSTGEGVVIRDFKLDGRDDLNTTGTQYGIDISGGEQSLVENISVSRVDLGIFLTNTSHFSEIINVVTDGITGTGIQVNSSDDVVVSKARVIGGSTGISLGNSDYAIVENSYVSSVSFFGIRINNSSTDNWISNNDTGAGNSGILVEGPDNTISNNNVSAASYGVHISGASARSNNVEGNTVKSASYGIGVTTATDNNITSNHLTNGTGYGIYLADSDENNISSNILNNTLAGLGIDNSSHNLIASNRIHDTGTYQDRDSIRIFGTNPIGNSIIGNSITDTDGSSYAISIESGTDTYLGNNSIGSGTAGAWNASGAINDAGTNTVYGGQSDDSGNFAIQGFSGAILLGENSADTLTVNATSTFNENLTVAATKTLTLIGGTTAQRPSSPNEGEIFFDTDTDTLLTYSNGKWQADRGEYVIVAASDSSQAEKDSADYVADGEGGDGDTVIDGDQIEINQALNSLSTSGKVLLLNGTYNIDDAIVIPGNDINFVGQGEDTIIFAVNSSNITGGMIRESAVSGRVMIAHMQIDANRSNQASSSYVINMSLGSGDGVSMVPGLHLDSVTVKNSNVSGVNLAGGRHHNIENSKFINNGGGGYSGLDNITYSRVTNNSFHDNYSNGVRALSYNVISGNYFDTEARGVGVQGDYNTITGNTFKSSGSGVELVASDHNTVTGNTFINSKLYSVFSDHNNLSNNVFEGAGTSSSIMYIFQGDGNTIAGNSIVSEDTGIQFVGPAVDNSVIGNHLEGTNGAALPALTIGTDVNDTYVSQNTIKGTYSSINDAGTNTAYGGQTDGSGNYNLQGFSGSINLGSDTDITGILTTTGNVGIGNASPGNLLSVGSLTTADANAQVAVATGADSNSGIIVQANSATQTADLFQAQDSTGTVLASIDANGNLAVVDAEVAGVLTLGNETLTITDDGTANDSLTPSTSYARIDIDETANGGVPDLTIDETNASDGDTLVITNNELDGTHDTFTITDSAGVVSVPGGSVTLGPEDSISLIYMNDRWVTTSYADN